MAGKKETNRIKHKHIREGFIFFVLATYSGYIINFTADGRTAVKNKKMEHELDPINGKIESMIMFIVEAKMREQKNRENLYINV